MTSGVGNFGPLLTLKTCTLTSAFPNGLQHLLGGRYPFDRSMKANISLCSIIEIPMFQSKSTEVSIVAEANPSGST